MEYMTIYRAKDAREATARFVNWTPPEGYQIKHHYFSPDGRGFALIESDGAVPLVAAMAAFVDVMDFEFVPVAPIEAAIPATLESFKWVDGLPERD